jgi:hypothetical protein
VDRVRDGVVGVYGGGFDVGIAAERLESLLEMLGGPALRVRAGPAALERDQAVDLLEGVNGHSPHIPPITRLESPIDLNPICRRSLWTETMGR